MIFFWVKRLPGSNTSITSLTERGKRSSFELCNSNSASVKTISPSGLFATIFTIVKIATTIVVYIVSPMSIYLQVYAGIKMAMIAIKSGLGFIVSPKKDEWLKTILSHDRLEFVIECSKDQSGYSSVLQA